MKALHSGDHVVVKNLKFINVTLSFGRLRQRIVLKCVPHVQHDYFSSFNQSHRFLALSLPLPSSLLELETLRNRTAGWLRTAEWRKNVARHRAFSVLRYIFFVILPAWVFSPEWRRQQQGKSRLKINICRVMAVPRLSHLVHILQCWRSALYLDWCARRWITYRELKIYFCFAQVVKTANAQNSLCCFAEDITELFLNACRTTIFLSFLHAFDLSCD